MSAPKLSIALPKANADPFAAAQKQAALKVQKAQAALPPKPRVVVRPLVKANQGLKQSLESVAQTAGGAKLKAPKPLGFAGLPNDASPAQAAGFFKAHPEIPHYDIAAHHRQQAAMLAPVLNVLNQTTRPLHGIAGGVDAAITGKPVGRAIVRGIENKDHTTFSRVLKDAGAPKAVQGIGGFAGDVLGDPTTYLTFGAGSIAKKALVDAAEGTAAKAAVREAAPSGLTIKVAGKELPGVRKATGATVGRVAMKAGQTRPALATRNILADVNPNIAPAGVSKYAHQEATSIARTQRAAITTAQRSAQASGVALKKAIGPDSQQVIDAVEAGKAHELPAHLRDAAQHMTATQDALHAREQAAGVQSDTIGPRAPLHVPVMPGLEETRAAVKAAQRERVKAEIEHRALLAHEQDRERVVANVPESATVGAGRSVAGGQGVQQAVNALQASARRVTAAREAEKMAQAAHDATVVTRRDTRKLVIKNTRLAAEPQGYVPHFTTESMQAGKPSTIIGGKRGVGKATVRIVSQNARAAGRNKPLAVLRQEHPGAYSEDLPLLHANRQIIGETGIANAHANERLAELGRPYNEHNVPGENEGVFKLDGAHLTEVTDAQLLARARKGYTQGGKQFVVLDKRVVAKGRDERTALSHGEGVGKFFDRNTGRFKRVATFTPGFHVRNLIGDTQNAYLAQPAYRMPSNFVRSGKTLKALKRGEEAQRTLGATAKPVSGSVKIGGEHVTYEQLAHEAAGVGAIRAGFQNREITDLLHPEQGAVKKISEGPRAGRAVKRTAQSREDLPRLSTYIEARRKGMDPEAAARYVAEHHFDYANLTDFERNVARRVMPFYCVPTDHEILTRRGFRRHDEVEVGEDVMSLDHDAGTMQWTPLLEVATFDYDGPLSTIKRRGADFAFTADHRWPIISGKTFNRRMNKHYGDKKSIKRAHDLCKTDRVPLTGDFRDDGSPSSLTPRHASILGWLISDGYFRWRGEHCEMMIYQSPKKHLSEIEALLGHAGRKPHPQTGVVCVGVQAPDRVALLTAGFKTKDDLLQIVGGLSREAANSMWEAMFKAEGWTVPATGQRVFSQVAGPVLETFQMLCYMTGRACNIGPARLPAGHWSRQKVSQAYLRKDTHLQVGELGEIAYTGTLWCPRTEHGTWVMRHNGCVVVTGNTFSARNIPLQTRKLLQKPGKAAAIQKVREEAAIAAGLKPGYESGESPADQRNAGIPIRIGGKVYNLSAGLPITDLNETPGAKGLSPVKQAGEYIDKGLQLTNPLIKAPVELTKNISLYTGKPLKDKTHLLSPAPSVVSILPDSVKKLLGATQALDKRTGKQVWMWDPYTNYVAHAVPGLPALALGAATAAAGVTGKGTGNQAIGAAGVKATPIDPQSAALNVLYQELGAINDKLGILSAKGIVGANSTPARAALNAKVRDLNTAIYQLKAKRGDKILPKTGGASSAQTIDQQLNHLASGGSASAIDQALHLLAGR